jgi:hypothetical protein
VKDDSTGSFVVIAVLASKYPRMKEVIDHIFKRNAVVRTGDFLVDPSAQPFPEDGQNLYALGSPRPQNYLQFLVEEPSEREIKLLGRLHDELNVSVSMTIPPLGCAILTASNCEPTRYQLHQIFFGDDSAYLNTIYDDSDLGYSMEASETDTVSGSAAGAGDRDAGMAAKRNSSSSTEIQESSVETVRKLIFNDPRKPGSGNYSTLNYIMAPTVPSTAPSVSTLSVSQTASVSDAKVNALMQTMAQINPKIASSACKPLVQDVPLGVRLLNSYRTGYKDRYVCTVVDLRYSMILGLFSVVVQSMMTSSYSSCL